VLGPGPGKNLRTIRIVPGSLRESALHRLAIDALGREPRSDGPAPGPARDELVLGELAREPLVVDQADGFQSVELPRDLPLERYEDAFALMDERRGVVARIVFEHAAP
jgi:hypothetical protein